MKDQLFKNCSCPILVLSYILSLMVAYVVYVTGGTNYAYVMFMNIPIIMASFTSNKINGFLHASISGLLVGPYMPLNVKQQIMQAPLNWMIRLVYFLIMSITVMIFVSRYKKQHDEVLEKDKAISESHMSTIYALVKLSESRDDETGAHVERVSYLCKHITEKLRELPEYKLIDEEFVDNIFEASSLHDIGKVGIQDSILLKEGKLTTQEFKAIKKHTIIGSSILNEVQKNYPHNNFLLMGIDISLSHHERWDGTGYPYGLTGEDIPLAARIMAIVDAYDAMRSKRVYKESFSHEKCLEIITSERGKHFEPRIVDVFVDNHLEFNAIYNDLTNKFK